VDLFSRELQKRLSQSKPVAPDIECLPHFHSEAEPTVALGHPITLNPYRPGKLQGGANGMLPWARLAATPLDRLAGDPWAEINAQDAQTHSIRDLDWMWIESATGKIKVRAVIHPGAAPGVVNAPYSLGVMGRSGQERGVNPLELIVPQRDPLSGLTYRFGTKVKIYKA
jgi:anaerobic selenocysteine-containing dehydrogenase